jgi:glycosyltransferase involved in cell wall biosynthesis
MAFRELAPPDPSLEPASGGEGDRSGLLDLTLLVCTHDKERLLDRALAAVAEQELPPGRSWEVVVVDNRSTDGTREIADSWAADGRIPRLRCVSEPRLGVSFARKRGLREARGRLVGFVDDDCLLDSDWAARALAFAEEHPGVGAFGGRNELLWESPPTRLAELYGESLARQDLGPCPCPMPVTAWRMPVGAGLVLRREAVIASGWVERGVLRARHPRNLGAGEDAELALRIRRAGWEVWYSPELRLRHVIPPERMTLRYLRRLHRGFGRADVFLRALHRAPQPHPRLDGLRWAGRVLREVLERYQEGYLRYEEERPTWLIRLSYAAGCLEGAALFLLTGRGW